ncbi:MAG TPA: alpha/beta fold hydrolase [Trueperaceae bacterium]|nr:alpha/beta fold hydrolase [Trueperaceae bacterium]
MLLVLLVLVLVVAAALAAVGWVFSSRVIVPAPYGLMPEFDITSVAPDTGQGMSVTLPVEPEPNQHANTLVDGVYGLLWEGGHARLGDVTARDAFSAVRRLGPVTGTAPTAGVPARIDNFVFRNDPLTDLGIAFEELSLAGPEGALRAWFVPGTSRTAVLVLHGRRRGELIETLRMLGPLDELGLPTLALAYRNHDRSDPSSDGLYHYGADEWQDAVVGVRELAARGADRVVLFGLSMGGAVALEAVKHWSADLPELVGVVLDSPLVDVYDTIELGAVKAALPLPGPLTRLALYVAGLRTGVDFSELSQARTAGAIPVPVMVIAGVADSTVPIESVDTFTAGIRTPLTYHRLEGVEHVEAWNVDPDRYAAWLSAFVGSLEIRASVAGARASD